MAGLYIHIPFCSNKCFYCDFFSGNQLYLVEEYVAAVISEVELRVSYIENRQIDSIYFGGGTPSLLSYQSIEGILNKIHKFYKVSPTCEITLECNPENINSNYLEEVFKVGINRISLGVQFLNDIILQNFNRKHSKALVINALNDISESSITNLSVDIIFSVPGIGNDELHGTLEQILKFDIKHISAYCLTIAKNSQLFWKIGKGQIIENEEDVFLSQYGIVYEHLLSKGFLQYEVSNYALEGYQSRHNFGYWNQEPYLGMGVSAHSFNLKSRQWNTNNIKKYIRDLKIGIVNFDKEDLSIILLYNEYIILRLRTYLGISPQFILSSFGIYIYEHFEHKIALLMKQDHFARRGELIVPLPEDLLLSDYFAKILMY
jgi:oxygen-independent coproporphyrinogen-3 oxidase